jgi:DNA-nicking Smr family endonuclease
MATKNRKPFANPFGKLKGFSASAPPEAPKAPSVPPAKEPEEVDFALEMARLGVQPKQVSPATPGRSEVTAGSEVRQEPAADDRELFLGALGRLETTFEDGLPEDAEPSVPPRRMKLVRQGKLVPEATLDLHGLDRHQAREKVKFFLENALWQGKRTVLVVTGRGLGSGGEPVLRDEIERFLAGPGVAWVSEWGRAPARFGGDGALVVFVRERKK